MSTEKISLYNLPDLKNTSDDALTNYLNSLKFTQSHYYQDLRLALGYGSFFVAAACFLWDYKLGFEATKYYTVGAVAVYLILNSVLSLFQQFVERNIIYIGSAPGGETITIGTKAKKNTNIYDIHIVVQDGAKQHEYNISKSFGEWFDQLGYFVAKPLQKILASNVPLIAKLDPKRAKPTQDMIDHDPELMDAVLAAAGNSTGADTDGARQRKA